MKKSYFLAFIFFLMMLAPIAFMWSFIHTNMLVLNNLFFYIAFFVGTSFVATLGIYFLNSMDQRDRYSIKEEYDRVAFAVIGYRYLYMLVLGLNVSLFLVFSVRESINAIWTPWIFGVFYSLLFLFSFRDNGLDIIKFLKRF